jgi:hypothetical protein
MTTDAVKRLRYHLSRHSIQNVVAVDVEDLRAVLDRLEAADDALRKYRHAESIDDCPPEAEAAFREASEACEKYFERFGGENDRA